MGEHPHKWSDEKARAIMREAGFEPTEPYKSQAAPWNGVCLVCGFPSNPRLGSILRGQRACNRCSREKRPFNPQPTLEAALQVRTTFEREAEEMMLAAGLQPLAPYENMSRPWPCRCLACGHEVEPSFNSVRRGRGCRYCAGNAVDPAEAEEFMRSKGLIPSIPYPGANSPWEGTCSTCGSACAPYYSSVRSGQGVCDRCGRESGIAKRRIPDEDARAVMLAAGVEPLEPYPGLGAPWSCRCQTCSRTVKVWFANVRAGAPACGYCAGRRVDPLEAVQVMEKVGFRPLEPYPGSDEPWLCECTTCGDVSSPRYGNVKGQGTRCRACSFRSQAERQRLSDEEARARMLEFNFQPSIPYQGAVEPWPGVCLKCGQPISPAYHWVNQNGGACGYCVRTRVDSAVAVGKMMAADFEPLVPYPGANTPWKGRCLKCGGITAPRYNAVTRGEGACGLCRQYGFSTGRPGVFYLVTDGIIIKGGISNVPEERLAKHATFGLTTVIEILEFERGADAYALERLWLEHLAEHPHLAVPPDRLPDGYTEAIQGNPATIAFIDQIRMLGF